MKLTKEILMLESSRYREFYHGSLKDSKGNPVKCRVSGRLKTWKTRPDDFRLPVKWGLNKSFYITPENIEFWEIPSLEI